MRNGFALQARQGTRRRRSGAWFALRSRLAPRSPLAERLAAPEAAAGIMASASVKVLAGGTAAWEAAGRPLEQGREHAADELDDDAILKPYDHEGQGVEAYMKEYLSWEINLVEQIERDGSTRFQHFPA